MASNTTQGAIKPSEEQLDALAAFVRGNMEIVKSQKSGKFYVTLNKAARNGEFGGLEARIDFCAMGLGVASEKSANRVESIAERASKLTPEEKLALLEELSK